jgi:hypothetical protein
MCVHNTNNRIMTAFYCSIESSFQPSVGAISSHQETPDKIVPPFTLTSVEQ